MIRIGVAPHIRLPGVPKPTARLNAYEQVDLHDALTREWKTDALAVGYLVDGFTGRQPRLTKRAILGAAYSATMTVFFCDIDNAGHSAWTDEGMAQAIAFDRENLSTEGVYYTRGGRRLVQPLLHPVSVSVAELHLRTWLLELEARGYLVDWNCRDWTHHFRLPYVVRDGKPYRPPFIDLARMQPIELPPLPELPPQPERKPRQTGGAAALEFSLIVPDAWKGRAEPIGRAISETVAHDWHAMQLALAGTLLGRGLLPEQLPELMRSIAVCANYPRPESFERSARDTARNWADGIAVTGAPTLAREWPCVSAALERAMLGSTYAVTEAAPKAEPKTLAQTIADLEEAIRSAPDGLTVIAAECGLGKTKAAERVAVERAQKRHLTVVDSGRAPAQSKTSISVDKTDLAVQIVRDLRAEGLAVRRVFGPLSLKNEDGVPLCIHHEVAEPLVAGGQSLQLEFCEGRGRHRCEVYETCRARLGAEGPDDARITVGPHGLLGELSGEAGTTGLLVIDEPPAAIDMEMLSRDDLKAALQRLNAYAFEDRFYTVMAPAVRSVADWFDRRSQGWIDIKGQVNVSTAFDETATRHVPPIREAEVFLARATATYARALGSASRVLGIVYRALVNPSAAHLRGEHIIIALPNERLSKAIKRDGATVIMDANADIHLSAYSRILRYDPPVHRFAAEDGAPIDRTLLRTGCAKRKAWIPDGKLVLNTGLLHAIREALEWAAGDKLAIISYRLVELILRAAMKPDEEAVDREWNALKQSRSTLEEARRELIELRGEKHLVGHYGATRGMDHMKDVDCLATIGDPWPNMDSANLLGEFCKQDVSALLEAFARAELEQAHGRLRAVHRARPARALHVGAVVPGGTGWAGGRPKVVQMPGGRPKGAAHMSPDELLAIVERLGGQRKAAEFLQCPRSSLQQYLSGKSPIPAASASSFRATNGKVESGTPS